MFYELQIIISFPISHTHTHDTTQYVPLRRARREPCCCRSGFSSSSSLSGSGPFMSARETAFARHPPPPLEEE